MRRPCRESAVASSSDWTCVLEWEAWKSHPEARSSSRWSAGTRVLHRGCAFLTAPATSSGLWGLKLRFEWRAPRVARAPPPDGPVTHILDDGRARAAAADDSSGTVGDSSGTGGNCERTGSTTTGIERIVVLQLITTRSGSCQWFVIRCDCSRCSVGFFRYGVCSLDDIEMTRRCTLPSCSGRRGA